MDNLHALLGGTLLLIVAFRFWVQKILVPEGHVGLLYLNGKFERTLAPGRHYRLRSGRRCEIHDVRRRVITVPGQEVLSADNVGLKLSISASYEIVDAARAVHTDQNYLETLYAAPDSRALLFRVVGED